MTQHKKVCYVSNDNKRIIKEYLDYKTNQKPIARPRNLVSPLRMLSDYLKDKSLKDATNKDLMFFLKPDNGLVSLNSRHYIYMQVKLFYRWIDQIDRHTIPDRLRWYEPITNKAKRMYLNPERRENHFITQDDYDKMIKFSNDAYGQDKALWETFYLSSIRPEEMPHLKIGDIYETDEGHYEVIIREGYSKTLPRQIPLVERPDNLIRWLGNHPDRKNKDTPLWISYKSKSIKGIDRDAMYIRFNSLKKKSGIKSTLQLKSFRKNRATIMFNQPDKYDDGKMAQFFGWQPITVSQRRIEYDLSNYDDLKKVIWTKPEISISYDTLKKEKEVIENKYKKQLKKQEKQILKIEQENKNLRKDMNIVMRQLLKADDHTLQQAEKMKRTKNK